MKSILDWVKSNPLSLISAVVILLGLGFFVYVFFQGGDFTSRIASEGEQRMSTINGYQSNSVEVPPQNPDDPPQSIPGVTITQTVLNQLGEIQNRMDTESSSIFQFARDRNHRDHTLISESVFPGPSSSSARIEARRVYRDAFPAMLQSADATPSGGGDNGGDNAPPDASLPRLNAGTPPDPEQVSLAVTQAHDDYLQSVTMFGRGNENSGRNRGGGGGGITVEQSENLRSEMFNRMMGLLRSQAQRIDIYAHTDLGTPQAPNPDFPFQVAGWSTLESTPEPWQLWEGQLELWIQEDLARAIQIANQPQSEGANVLTNPVKQLIGMRVVPGYIGLHSEGAVNDIAVAAGDKNRAGRSGAGASWLQFQHGQSPATPYGPPAGGQTGNADQAIPLNFYVGPTGRMSNAIFDVRQAVLSVRVDYERLPELYDAIGQVNFMTVLNTHITDVDEYAALQQGYVFGSGDVVRADLVVETVWLRDWTAPLMPSLVRQYVGIDPPTTLIPTPAQ